MADYEYEEVESKSILPWLITGVLVGAAVGVLFAPKIGSELREDIGDYIARARRNSRGFWGRVSEKIPTRVKAAAGFGAIRGAARETYREAKERFSA